MTTTRITVTIPKDLHLILQDLSEDTGRSLSALVRDTLFKGLTGTGWSNVTDTIREALREGFTNTEALKYLQERKPDSPAGLDTVAWVRWDMRKGHDQDVPTDRQIRRHRRQV